MRQNTQTVRIEEAFAKAGELLLTTVRSSTSLLMHDKRVYYRDKPIEFFRDVLGIDSWKGQEEIAIALVENDKVVVRSSNSVGKTFIASSIALWFLSSFEPSTVVTTAPTSRQVKNLLWKEINSQYNKSRVPLGGRILQQELIMSDKGKWFATGFTIEEQSIDSFQGFHNDFILVVVDESCGVAKNIYNAIEGLLASGIKAKLLLIGNPTNEATEFGTAFKSPLYRKLHISAFDTPNFTDFGITEEDIRNNTYRAKMKRDAIRPYLVSPDWVRSRFVEWGEDSALYQVRVLGNFPKEGIDTLIPLYWIERAYDRGFIPDGLKIMGVDVGYEGDDESIVAIRHGNVVTKIYSWFHKSTMESAGQIVRLINAEKPNIINVDSIGVGAGVYDRLKELGFKVNGIKGGAVATKSSEYFNLRTELYWTMRTALERGNLELPKDDLLASDLSNLKFEPITSRGLIKLEGKDKVKKRIGRSPDRGDAVAYTFYEKQRVVLTEDISSAFGDTVMPQNKGFDFSKEREQSSLDFKGQSKKVCSKCGLSQGLVFYDDKGMATEENAKYIKCIICDVKEI